jgi:hypothetical protein
MPRPAKPAASVALLCGLHAVNAALQVLHKPPLNRDNMDEINAILADQEAMLVEDGNAQANAVEAEGNYPVDVVTNALQVYGSCEVERVQALHYVPRGLYVIGDGSHWQTVAHRENVWTLYDDGLSYPIQNVMSLLSSRLTRGAVLRIHAAGLPIEEPASRERKRAREPEPEPEGGSGTPGSQAGDLAVESSAKRRRYHHTPLTREAERRNRKKQSQARAEAKETAEVVTQATAVFTATPTCELLLQLAAPEVDFTSESNRPVTRSQTRLASQQSDSIIIPAFPDGSRNAAHTASAAAPAGGV